MADTLIAIQAFAAFLCVVCLVTALLDMGMNGSRYAGWAPWGLGIGAICLLIAGAR